MAHKKAGGSTSYGRDSAGQRLGIKIYAGEPARAGMVLVRQRGTKWHPGKNVRRGSDDTLYATANGVVTFTHRKKPNFTGRLQHRTIINIVVTK